MKMWSNDQPYTVGLPPSQGLPYQTLVVLTTHYGRTPRFNDDDGRDHNNAFRCVLAGAGVGKSCRRGYTLLFSILKRMR